MYELLLKWGLDSLAKFTGTKGGHELAILLEAIKTKNALIVERYKQAWSLNEKLSELVICVEEELERFVNEADETDGSWKSARQFIGKLRSDFHPCHYRKIVKLRSGFEGTNDMLSGYSYVFLGLLRIETLVSICKEKKIRSKGEICRLYRGLWTKYGEIIASVIRVTSGDLRFWITDTPYIEHVDKWAEHDLEKVSRSLCSLTWNGRRHHISIEKRRGLDRFWHELKGYHETNIEHAKNKSLPDKQSQSDA